MENKRPVKDKIWDFFSITASVCTLLGWTIFTLFDMSKEAFQKMLENVSITGLIIFMFLLLVYICRIIHNINVKKIGIDKIDYIIITFLFFGAVFYAIVFFKSAETKAGGIITDKQSSNSGFTDNDGEVIIEPEDPKIRIDVINQFILGSEDKVFSLEELNELSNDELYYIRNGIYAYKGVYFESGFYEVYNWYNGYTSLDDFDVNKFNQNQQNTVDNISYLEELRGIKK